MVCKVILVFQGSVIRFGESSLQKETSGLIPVIGPQELSEVLRVSLIRLDT